MVWLNAYAAPKEKQAQQEDAGVPQHNVAGIVIPDMFDGQAKKYKTLGCVHVKHLTMALGLLELLFVSAFIGILVATLWSGFSGEQFYEHGHHFHKKDKVRMDKVISKDSNEFEMTNGHSSGLKTFEDFETAYDKFETVFGDLLGRKYEVNHKLWHHKRIRFGIHIDRLMLFVTMTNLILIVMLLHGIKTGRSIYLMPHLVMQGILIGLTLMSLLSYCVMVTELSCRVISAFLIVITGQYYLFSVVSRCVGYLQDVEMAKKKGQYAVTRRASEPAKSPRTLDNKKGSLESQGPFVVGDIVAPGFDSIKLEEEKKDENKCNEV